MADLVSAPEVLPRGKNIGEGLLEGLGEDGALPIGVTSLAELECL